LIFLTLGIIGLSIIVNLIINGSILLAVVLSPIVYILLHDWWQIYTKRGRFE